MKQAPAHFEVKHLTDDDPEWTAALHLAMDLEPERNGRPAEGVRELIAHAAAPFRSLDLVFAAYEGKRMISAAVGITSPGRSALVLAPSRILGPSEESATAAALRALSETGRRKPLTLLQALPAPQAVGLARALKEAGFFYLTRLIYLRRPVEAPPLRKEFADNLEWIAYEPRHEPLFLDALEASYAGSLDCPKLVGLRSTRDALEGHRATGNHDPSLWWVVMEEAEPAGILLLSRLGGQSAVEIVYLGVAQSTRGKGVGDALTARAVQAGKRESANSLTLAVDCENKPARRLYGRWGFAQTGLRDAWVSSSYPARG